MAFYFFWFIRKPSSTSLPTIQTIRVPASGTRWLNYPFLARATGDVHLLLGGFWASAAKGDAIDRSCYVFLQLFNLPCCMYVTRYLVDARRLQLIVSFSNAHLTCYCPLIYTKAGLLPSLIYDPLSSSLLAWCKIPSPSPPSARPIDANRFMMS